MTRKGTEGILSIKGALYVIPAKAGIQHTQQGPPGLPGGEWRPKGEPSRERKNSQRGQMLEGAPGLPGGKPLVRIN